MLRLLKPYIYLSFIAAFLAMACNKPAPVTPGNHPDSTGTTTPDTSTSTAIIYVLGTVAEDTLILWRKGVPTILAIGSNHLAAYGAGMVLVDTNLYYAGGVGLTDTLGTASYWINGQKFPLQLSSGAVGCSATGIYVSGADVYVSGMMHFWDPPSVPFTPRWGFTACYWKNGQPTLLPDWADRVDYFGYFQMVGADYTTGIYVSGNDVYVAGGEEYPINHGWPDHFTGFWKNGQFTDLPNYVSDTVLTNMVSRPNTGSIAMVGNNLYISGYQYEFGTAYPTGIYWVNGKLDSVSPSQGEIIYSLQSVGSDIYMTSTHFQNGQWHAAYWKNGNLNLVDSSIYSTAAYSIFVSGNDIYVSGYKSINGFADPVYWKNGVETHLGFDGTAFAIVVR